VSDVTIEETMTVALSRCFGDREHGFIGLGTGDRAFRFAVGIPTAAAELANDRGADFCIQYGTLVDPSVQGLPETLGDPDLLRWDCAARLGVDRCLDVFRRGLMTCSFISGAQVDKFGNVNSVQIGRDRPPQVRLTGPIAQSDHSVYAQRTFVIVPHERRVFVEQVDFISAVGYGTGGDWRRQLGIPGGGPDSVITDMAVMGFHPETKQMTLHSVHPGVTVEQVVDATGFELLVPAEVPETPAPTDQELSAIRERIDPHRRLLAGNIK